MIFQKLSIFLVTLVLGSLAFGDEEAQSVNAVSPQNYRLILVKKSVHPQNFMAVDTKLAEDCSFIADPVRPGHALIDFYWLMDGKNYKPMNSMIKEEISGRFESMASQDPHKFVVSINDLKQVNTDIPAKNWKMDVVSTKSPAGCSVMATMHLGPSNKDVLIQLKELYTDATANILTRSVKIKSIMLTGTVVKTGEKISQVYKGR
jgi:hypothetical protein